MSGETEAQTSGWTVDTSHYHFQQQIQDLKQLLFERESADERLQQAEEKFREERDRRYTEVNIEREKALKIKETADLAALDLAREIQTYKDEKANQLREQINSERGLYATKEDLGNLGKEIAATVRPLTEFVSARSGGSKALDAAYGWIIAAAGVSIAIASFIFR